MKWRIAPKAKSVRDLKFTMTIIASHILISDSEVWLLEQKITLDQINLITQYKPLFRIHMYPRFREKRSLSFLMSMRHY